MSLPDQVPASHVPMIVASVLRSHGPIIEFGAGVGSTPLLHVIGIHLGRTVYTLENNLGWLRDLAQIFESPSHHMVHVDDWSAWQAPPDIHYGVAFVDCAPAEARAELVLKLKGHATYIVAHDTDAAPEVKVGSYGWNLLKGVFKYETVWKCVCPWTTVFSDEGSVDAH